MANVGFLLGSQSNLNALITNKTGIKEGSFYLTNDTNRLYFGKSATEIVALNEGVTNVATLNDLPSGANVANEVGHFYYVTGSNILCVYNGKQWVQINPDTDTQVNTLTQTAEVNNNAATLTTKLTFQRDGAVLTEANDKSATLSLIGSDLVLTKDGDSLKLTGDTYSFGTSAKDGNAIAINLTRANASDTTRAKTDSVKLIEGANITLTRGTDGNITIAAKDSNEYTIGENSFAVAQDNTSKDVTVTNTVKLSGSTTGVGDSLTLAEGNDDISLSVTDKKISISASKYTLSGETAATDNKATVNLNSSLDSTNKTNFTVAGGDNVTVTQSGTDLTVAAKDSYVSAVDVSNDVAGFTVKVTNAGNKTDTVTKSFDPKIKFGEEDAVSFVNGTATLVTTKLEEKVDNKITAALQTFDAMEFKGVTTATPTGNIKNGYTYKATSDFTIAAGSVEGSADAGDVKTGDLIVATGTEGADDGYLTTVKWYIVPSGDEVNTTYKFVAAANKVQLSDDSNNVVGTLEFADDDVIVATTGNTSGNTQKVTLSHAKVISQGTDATAAQTAKNTLDIAVPVLTYDEYGHVKTYATKTYTVTDTDTHNAVDTYKATVNANNTGVVHNLKTTDDTVAKTYEVKYTSSNDNLTVTTSASGDNATVAFNLTWGTF